MNERTPGRAEVGVFNPPACIYMNLSLHSVTPKRELISEPSFTHQNPLDMQNSAPSAAQEAIYQAYLLQSAKHLVEGLFLMAPEGQVLERMLYYEQFKLYLQSFANFR